MKIHLLHVKNGQCVIVDHGKRQSLIDIHKLSESDIGEETESLTEKYTKTSAGGYVHKATNPISYWRDMTGNQSAFRAIITHPDKDHLTGIDEFLDTIGSTNVWMPREHIDTIPDNEDGQRVKRIVNGEESGLTFIEPKRGSNNQFFGTGNVDWDQIQILHPASSHESDSANRGSYLIKIHYGSSSIMISGDTEKETFQWLLEKHPEDLDCTVFIASHHGRQTGWPGQDVMEHMNPLMVLIPKGKIESKDSALGNYSRVLGADRYLTTSYAGNIRVELNKDDDVASMECERGYVNGQLEGMLQEARKLRNG